MGLTIIWNWSLSNILLPSCAFSVNCCVNYVLQICTCHWLHVHILIYVHCVLRVYSIFYHMVIAAAQLNNTRIAVSNVDYKPDLHHLPFKLPLWYAGQCRTRLKLRRPVSTVGGWVCSSVQHNCRWPKTFQVECGVIPQGTFSHMDRQTSTVSRFADWLQI